MSAINLLMNRAKAASYLPSDYALAKRLGSAMSAVYDWRAGRRRPTSGQIILLAELAKEDEIYWLATIEGSHAKDDNVARIWRRIAATAR